MTITTCHTDWIDANWRQPATPEGWPKGLAITVLGVINDPRLIMPNEQPFVDVVSWWPHQKKWTVTHCTRADTEAQDYETVVSHWTPMLELPAHLRDN
jgi:hypothetical protein